MFRKTTKATDIRNLTAVIITAVFILIIGVISVNAMRYSDSFTVFITEIDNVKNINSTKKIKTEASNVQAFLNEQNITLSAYDFLNLDSSAPLNDRMKIIITRGTPFNIEEGSHITFCSTTKNTVGEALLECGHYPEENDIVTPALDTPISEGITVSITKVVNSTVTVTEEIANSIEYKNDNSLEKGKTAVLNEGHTGECTITFNIVCENGIEVLREEASRTVTKSPENKIIAVGTKEPVTNPKTNISGEKNLSVSNSSNTIAGFKYTKKHTMSATGYTAFRPDGSRYTTAVGKAAKHGIVAVDPKIIPLGTRLYIEGYGTAIAADTGSAIKGNKIDLCFEMTNSEIRSSFGRKTVDVYVLD